MKKGIVLELKKDYAVIGTEGKYIRVKRKDNMEIGRQIIYLEEDVMQMKEERKTFKLDKLIPVLTVALIAIMLTFNFYTDNLKVFAIVTVDINPSIELKLNKNQEVIEAIAMNDDASELDLASLEGLTIDAVVQKIIESSKEEGFIKEDEKTYIMVTTVNPLNQVETYDAIKTTLEESLELVSIEEKVNIGLSEATEDQLEEAVETKTPLSILALEDELDEDIDSIDELFEDEELKAFIESEGRLLEVEVELDDDGIEIEISIDENLEEELEDLMELLMKLEQVPEDETEILAFVEAAYLSLESEDANIKELKEQAKVYWKSVKDIYDISDDDDDEDEDDDDYEDLLELLMKLEQVPEDEIEILAFVEATYLALESEDANIKALKEEAKAYWRSVKDIYDIDDDDDDDEDDDDYEDLLELLMKLEQVPEEETEILAFVDATYLALESEDANIKALKEEAKSYWESVKDVYDIDDDDFDDDDFDDDSDDDDFDDDSDDDDFDDDSDDDDFDEDLEDLMEELDELEMYANEFEEVATFLAEAYALLESDDVDLEALEDAAEDLLDIIKEMMDDDEFDDSDDDEFDESDDDEFDESDDDEIDGSDDNDSDDDEFDDDDEEDDESND